MATGYQVPLNHNYNYKQNLAAGGVRNITFKDASAGLTRAKRLFIRIEEATGAHSGAVHYKLRSDHGTIVNATANNFFMYNGETLLEIPFFCAQIDFLNGDAGTAIDIYIDAYSDEDISGAAWT